jgi:hypothetical protein
MPFFQSKMCLKCPVCLLPTGPNIITSLDLCHPQDLDCVCVCVCVCGGGFKLIRGQRMAINVGWQKSGAAMIN